VDKEIGDEIFKQQVKLSEQGLKQFGYTDEEDDEVVVYEPIPCQTLYCGEDMVGAFGRVAEETILTAFHVLDDEVKTVVDDVVIYTFGVGHPANKVDFVLTFYDERHDYAFLKHHFKCGVAGPIYPMHTGTSGGRVKIDLKGMSYKKDLYPVKETQFYAMGDCKLEPGCSGVLATIDKKTVAVFLGMQEAEKVGIFVQPRRPDGMGVLVQHVVGLAKKEVFVSYTMYGKGKNKQKRRHRALQAGRVSQAEYEAVSRAFYEGTGRWATWQEMEELLEEFADERDYYEEEEEDHVSLLSADYSDDYDDDFAAEVGDFWQNAEAEDREDARLAQRFDIAGGRYAGNDPFFTPYGKKKGEVVGTDKVVLTETTDDKALAKVVKETLSANPFDDDDIVDAAYAAKPEAIKVDGVADWIDSAFADMAVEPSVTDRDLAIAAENKRKLESDAKKTLTAEEQDRLDFEAWKRSKLLPAKKATFAEVVATPDDLKGKAERLVAQMAARPDAPGKAFKAFSANEANEKLRAQIRAIEDTGIRLNYVVALTADEA